MSNLKEMSHKELINDLFINMMRSYPFYGHIGSMIAKVPVTNESGIMTFAVGKKTGEITLKMWYNTEYMDECIEKVGHEKAYIHFFEVIKHEILHVIFGHLSLNLPDKNRMAVAVDLSVNSYLKKDNFIKQDDGSNACMIPEDFKLEPKQTALYYYQKLIDNKQYNNMMKQENKDGTIKQAVSSHSHWEEIANDQVSQEILKDLVRKAKETCENNQMWGNTPSELISRIEDLIKFKKPLIPWSRVLKLFTASCSETEIDYTMRKRSKRFGTRPGIKKFEKLKLAIGIDTSGSISNEQLNLFLNELKWIEKEGGYVHIYECDTEIKRDYPFKKYDGNFTGRGGTNLEPVLKRVSEEKYDALIFFTDFYTPKIETNYHIPTLWVLSENNMEKEDFPYLFPGNVYIRIKDDMDGCERV